MRLLRVETMASGFFFVFGVCRNRLVNLAFGVDIVCRPEVQSGFRESKSEVRYVEQTIAWKMGDGMLLGPEEGDRTSMS